MNFKRGKKLQISLTSKTHVNSKAFVTELGNFVLSVMEETRANGKQNRGRQEKIRVEVATVKERRKEQNKMLLNP